MRRLLIIGFILAISFGYIQAQTDNPIPASKKTHSIKLGSFFQNDLYYSYYNNNYDMYSQNLRTNPLGSFYLAYEYNIEFVNKKTFAIEPKAGMIFRDGNTGLVAGNDFKFFWLNTPIYKMGASFYFGYRYISEERTETISLENGMYQQVVSFSADLNYLDWDLSFIPFQFTFPNVNMNIESHIGFGITHRFEQVNDDQLKPEIQEEFNRSSTHPYFPKIGIKIGYVFGKVK